jgi:hypothetical protein
MPKLTQSPGRYRQPMELYESIIKNGKISSISARIHIWGIPIFFLLASMWAVYRINFTPNPVRIGETEYYRDLSNLILSILFTGFAIFSIYLLSKGERILKTVFIADTRSLKEKERVIEKLQLLKKWKLSKSDTNYYQFFENNYFLVSYDITIVFNADGFFVNTFPTYSEIIDFGGYRKISREICNTIKGCL